jgi:hypothetical protein
MMEEAKLLSEDRKSYIKRVVDERERLKDQKMSLKERLMLQKQERLTAEVSLKLLLTNVEFAKAAGPTA